MQRHFVILVTLVNLVNLTAAVAEASDSMYMSIGPDGTPIVTDYPRGGSVHYEPGDFERIALAQRNTPHRGLGWQGTPAESRAEAPRIPMEIEALLAAAADRHRVPLPLLRAIAAVESGFRTHAVSRAGALGLMQLMPDTARDMGVADPFDAAENVNGGARYLAFLLKHFKDDALAVAAYNAGPGRVGRLGRIPELPETQAYVRSVLGLARSYAR